MSYESRAYDNEHGDPVLVLVTTGTHDVSRLVNLLAGNRVPVTEHLTLAERLWRQVRRHNGGRAALKLLTAHGGPDLIDTPRARAEERVLQVHDDEVREYVAQERGRDMAKEKSHG
jgi:hypothetical protein